MPKRRLWFCLCRSPHGILTLIFRENVRAKPRVHEDRANPRPYRRRERQDQTVDESPLDCAALIPDTSKEHGYGPKKLTTQAIGEAKQLQQQRHEPVVEEVVDHPMPKKAWRGE